MRKLLFISLLAVLGIAVNAQWYNNGNIGVTQTIAIDTLTAAVNDTSTAITVTSEANSITFQALCTELGGTSDGTLRLEGSVDGTSYLTIEEGLINYALPNDTLTITDGAVWQFSVVNAPFKKYRVIGTGTASDTTLITLTYILK